MAVPKYTTNNRLTFSSAADVDAYYASKRHKDGGGAGTAAVEDVPAFANTSASQLTNSRMSLS